MSSKDKKPSKPSTGRTGGIRTLSDLNRRSGPDSDSDSDGPQEYYTGGEKRPVALKPLIFRFQIRFHYDLPNYVVFFSLDPRVHSFI